MEQKQIEEIKKISAEYGVADSADNLSKINELKALDKKVKRPAAIFACVYGAASSLILGVGMCLCMGVIFSELAFAMPLGVGIGLAGIALALSAYPLYKSVLKARKKKYAGKILQLSNDLLNKNA